MLKTILVSVYYAVMACMLGFIVFNWSLAKPYFEKGHVDARVHPYINKFMDHCKLYKADCSKIVTLAIGIDKLPFTLTLLGDVIGACQFNQNNIILKEEYWNDATYAERENLVFHELAHCILDQDHTEGFEDNIMNPIAIADETYVRYYQELHNKLFNCRKDCPAVYFDRRRYL